MDYYISLGGFVSKWQNLKGYLNYKENPKSYWTLENWCMEKVSNCRRRRAPRCFEESERNWASCRSVERGSGFQKSKILYKLNYYYYFNIINDKII